MYMSLLNVENYTRPLLNALYTMHIPVYSQITTNINLKSVVNVHKLAWLAKHTRKTLNLQFEADTDDSSVHRLYTYAPLGEFFFFVLMPVAVILWVPKAGHTRVCVDRLANFSGSIS